MQVYPSCYEGSTLSWNEDCLVADATAWAANVGDDIYSLAVTVGDIQAYVLSKIKYVTAASFGSPRLGRSCCHPTGLRLHKVRRARLQVRQHRLLQFGFRRPVACTIRRQRCLQRRFGSQTRATVFNPFPCATLDLCRCVAFRPLCKLAPPSPPPPWSPPLLRKCEMRLLLWRERP